MSSEPQTDHQFEALLDYLHRYRGFDFTGYKRPSLMRRVTKRMQQVDVADFTVYMDYLQVHQDEFTELFNTILINVTSFFRDEEAWRFLAAEVIPDILASKPPAEPIRIWCTGCASGEEPYTLAMLLCEAIGLKGFHERVKIYATDIDDEALEHARQATYAANKVEAVPEPLREKYFIKNDDSFVFNPELRRAVIFGRHDLVQDAPISRLDLLVCRNTLMYFNSETQGRILSRFNFALNDLGFLFLGKAEMLLTHANLFNPVEIKYRIFTKAVKSSVRDRLLAMAQAGDAEAMDNLGQLLALREISFDAGVAAQLVVDTAGSLVLVNEKARNHFGLVSKDIGRPLQDLEISYRPVELRSLIERAYSGRHAIKLSKVERHLPDGGVQYLDVQVLPVFQDDGTMAGASITFDDVTIAQKLQLELQRSNHELETINEELQSAHEELETTNEELQSTNEELETTNEELQSTNEELETMNEELASTNEELETINGELRQAMVDLNSTNSFLQSILTSIRAAVVAIDDEGRITIWNRRAEDMWGMRADEVTGTAFAQLDIGLPIKQLEEEMQRFKVSKEKHRDLTMAAINRTGKSIQCDINITPLLGASNDDNGYVIAIYEKHQNDGRKNQPGN